jgi:hypothetical protein
VVVLLGELEIFTFEGLELLLETGDGLVNVELGMLGRRTVALRGV